MDSRQLTEEIETRETPALSRQPSDIAMLEQNNNSDGDTDSNSENDSDDYDESDIESNGESERDMPLGHITGIRKHPCEQCVWSLVHEQGDSICYNIAGSKRCKLCHESGTCEDSSNDLMELAEEFHSLRDLKDKASKKRHHSVHSELSGVLYPDGSEAEDYGMDTSSRKELSPSPLSRKQPSNSTLSTGVRKPGLMNPPVKRRGENLESSRLKSPSTRSGEFNLNNSEISNSSFNESPSTYPMSRLSTNLTAQARSPAVGSPTKTLDEEPLSDDSDLLEAQLKELDARVANRNARKQKQAEAEELARRRKKFEDNQRRLLRRREKETSSKVLEESNTPTEEEIYQTEMARSRQVRENRIQAAKEDEILATYKDEQPGPREQNQVPLPSTEDPAWVREAKADLGEYHFQIFCIQAEIIARRTGR